MNKEKKSLLIALSLGDGHIDRKGCFQATHTINHKEYVEWKQQLLNQICTPHKKYQARVSYRERFDDRTGKMYKSGTAYKQHKYFRILRNWLYKPHKKYQRHILNKLTPQGLAIWFQDDGNLRKNISKKTNKVSSVQVSLYTHCSLEEAEVVRNYFREVWQIEFAIYIHKLKTSISYYLCANTQNGLKFINLISPYVICSCMKYKIDLSSTRT